MSRRRVYSDNTLAIMERFFTAFDIAVQNRLIKSIAEYCRDNSIAPPHFYTQRKTAIVAISRSDGSFRWFGIAAYPRHGS